MPPIPMPEGRISVVVARLLGNEKFVFELTGHGIRLVGTA